MNTYKITAQGKFFTTKTIVKADNEEIATKKVTFFGLKVLDIKQVDKDADLMDVLEVMNNAK